MLTRFMEKILIAGAGITGAVTSATLRKHLPEKCKIIVWDKARGAGGRMGTSRCPSGRSSTVDLGAQYISSEPDDYQKSESIYQELESAGLLLPVPGIIEGDRQRVEGSRNFISPSGTGSIVKHFLHKSGAELKFNHTIKEIKKNDNQYVVTTDTGVSEEFDCVVLTMPVPQILEIQGSMQTSIAAKPDIRDNLQAVQYSSRFAMGLFYEAGTNIDVPWCAKYFPGDPVVVFISVDDKKRGSGADDVGPSVVIHAGVPFSLSHLEENKEDVCSNYLLPRAQELVPQLSMPKEIKAHKWRYSQVFKGYPGSPGALVVEDVPMIICGGDAFASIHRFDGCLESASCISNAVVNHSKQAQL